MGMRKLKINMGVILWAPESMMTVLCVRAVLRNCGITLQLTIFIF